MARVLLVYPRPDVVKEWRFGYSLSLLRCAAILRDAGHHVAWRDYSSSPFLEEQHERDLAASDVVVVELDAFTLKRALNSGHGRELAELAKRAGAKVVGVGHDLALCSDHRGWFDAAIASHPEPVVRGTVDAVLAGAHPPPPHPRWELDDLPFAARDLVPPFAAHGGSLNHAPTLAKSTLVETSRGCGRPCRFCQRRAWTDRVRAHSVGYVVRELTHLRDAGYRNVWVVDDNFAFDLARAKAVLAAIAADGATVGMRLALSASASIDGDFLDLARAAGVSVISVGVESASPEIQRFYRKPVDLARLGALIAQADALGLYTVANVIVGAPMETADTIRATLAYVADTPFDRVNAKVLDYMPGAPLYEALAPDLSKGGDHVFACREHGLTPFPLAELRQRLATFRATFTESRTQKLRRKIETFGPPYALR